MKKILLSALLAVLAITGVSLAKPAEASAASTYNAFYLEHWAHYAPIRTGLSVSDGPGVVYASINQDNDCNGCQFNWTMTLYRETEGYNTWVPIGTRTGYVSGVSPSHRTFYNIGDLNTRLRVKLEFAEKTIWSTPFYK